MESHGISQTGPLTGRQNIKPCTKASSKSGTDARVKHKASSRPEGLSTGKDVSTGLSGKGDCSSLLLNDVKPAGGDAGNVLLPSPESKNPFENSLGVFGGPRRR